MGEIVQLRAAPHSTSGTIHCWQLDDGQFEIGHESFSGNSWGWFSVHLSADAALIAARDLRTQIARECGGPLVDINFPQHIAAQLEGGGHAA